MQSSRAWLPPPPTKETRSKEEDEQNLAWHPPNICILPLSGICHLLVCPALGGVGLSYAGYLTIALSQPHGAVL